MRPPETFIAELLREYDCVVVPGFGGFLARYSVARINTLNSRIVPPQRVISFNRKLNTNDGLLAARMSEAEGIDIERAGKAIRDFSSSLDRELKANGKVAINGVGRFKVDEEQNILFEPDHNPDLWDDGFGLAPVYAPPVFREERSKRALKERAYRKPAHDSRGVPLSVKLTMAVAVPIIMFLVYGILDPAGIKKIPADYSSLVDFKRWSSILPVKPDKVIVAEFPSQLTPVSYKVSLSTIIPQFRETGDLAFIDLSGEIPEIIGVRAKTAVRYYIIGASFNDRDQALRLAKELIYNGYQPALISDPDRNRFRVSYFSYESKSKALASLANIREEKNPEAWLLKR
jgi:hypothetical protein